MIEGVQEWIVSVEQRLDSMRNAMGETIKIFDLISKQFDDLQAQINLIADFIEKCNDEEHGTGTSKSR